MQHLHKLISGSMLYMSPPVAQCVAWRAPICSNAYGGWFASCAHHCVSMTYYIRQELLWGCSGALEYPTTNSCGPINESLSLSLYATNLEKCIYMAMVHNWNTFSLVYFLQHNSTHTDFTHLLALVPISMCIQCCSPKVFSFPCNTYSVHCFLEALCCF